MFLGGVNLLFMEVMLVLYKECVKIQMYLVVAISRSIQGDRENLVGVGIVDVSFSSYESSRYW